MLKLPAFLEGVVAGRRAFETPMTVAQAAHLCWPTLKDGPPVLPGCARTPWIPSTIATVEGFSDQLPQTASRTVPEQPDARLVSRAVSGAAIEVSCGTAAASAGGLLTRLHSSLVGTFGRSWAHGRLAETFWKGRPTDLVADAVAILGGRIVLDGSR